VSDPYGSAHQAIRKAMLAVASPADLCRRCGKPLGPDAAKVDLGHVDGDPTRYGGLEHAACNRAAGAKFGNQLRRQRQQRGQDLAEGLAEVAVAVEVSQDRAHTAVCTAGYLDGDLVLVDLASYTDGTDPVPVVVELQQRRTVLAVAVDPHSPAATAIVPLEAARVKVTRPSSSDLVVAHGLFLDALTAGRVRHRGQAVLTAGMRALEARRLGGATAPERRSNLADVAPGIAAVLACWALERAPRPHTPFAVSS
jgi:hypothetical protein